MRTTFVSSWWSELEKKMEFLLSKLIFFSSRLPRARRKMYFLVPKPIFFSWRISFFFCFLSFFFFFFLFWGRVGWGGGGGGYVGVAETYSSQTLDWSQTLCQSNIAQIDDLSQSWGLRIFKNSIPGLSQKKKEESYFLGPKLFFFPHGGSGLLGKKWNILFCSSKINFYTWQFRASVVFQSRMWDYWHIDFNT